MSTVSGRKIITFCRTDGGREIEKVESKNRGIPILVGIHKSIRIPGGRVRVDKVRALAAHEIPAYLFRFLITAEGSVEPRQGPPNGWLKPFTFQLVTQSAVPLNSTACLL
jgi:hypothetical protein